MIKEYLVKDIYGRLDALEEQDTFKYNLTSIKWETNKTASQEIIDNSGWINKGKMHDYSKTLISKTINGIKFKNNHKSIIDLASDLSFGYSGKTYYSITMSNDFIKRETALSPTTIIKVLNDLMEMKLLRLISKNKLTGYKYSVVFPRKTHLLLFGSDESIISPEEFAKNLSEELM